MFKYDQFPIIKLQVYNNQGILHHKTLRQKSHKPYLQTSTHHLLNIIDFETSEHLTLKTIYKTKNINKDTIIAEISNQEKVKNYGNFIKIKQVYQDHSNIYIMMQENNMNLQEILEKRITLFERQVQYIFCQLVTILENLRALNIFHGGICLRNLYLDRNTMRIKLSGFGHSINIEKVKTSTHVNLYSETELTPYTAPELLDNSIDSPEMYYAGDIWSVGVVLYTLLIGQQPFTYLDEEKKLRTPSISKLKNFMYQFPTLSLSLTEQLNPSPPNKKQLKQPQIPHCQYNRKGSITGNWKQLLKQIFTPKEHRIQLQKLIQHQLNMIVESKFGELTCENVPVIANHWLSKQQESGYVDVRKTVRQAHDDRTHYTNPLVKSLAFPRLLFTSKYQQLPQLPSIVYSPSNQQLLTGGQLNTSILKLCLQQHKAPLPVPLLSRQSCFIQKYCYIQKHNCLGYILQNSIGVIYADGSCTIGQESSKYTYISNEKEERVEDIVRVYTRLYDEYYGCGVRQQDRYGTGGSESDYVNENSSNNININTNQSNNNTSRHPPKTPNNNTLQSRINNISNSHSNIKHKKSKMLQILPSSHLQTHSHTNSNPSNSQYGNSRSNGAFYQKGHHKLNSSGSVGIFNKTVSINQNIIQHHTNNNSNNNININNNINNNGTNNTLSQFTKIGQSLLASSYYNNSSSSKNKKAHQITKHKYEIFAYLVQYFGDRAIDNTKKEWVIGFWKIKCGVVFLYNTGNWQINLNQGITNNSSASKTNSKQSVNEYQSAILIDKYGLAWWLKSNPISHPNGPTHEDTPNIQQINNNIKYRNKNHHNIRSANDDYNYLCVKIARKIVRDIRELYVREFEDMMEPYRYR